MSSDGFLKRRKMFLEKMKKNGISCSVLYARDFHPNFYYLTGVVDFVSILLADAEDDKFVLFLTCEDLVPKGFEGEVRKMGKDSIKELSVLLKNRKTVCVDFSLPHHTISRLSRDMKIPLSKMRDISELILKMRAVKDDAEVDKVKKSCDILEKLFEMGESEPLWKHTDEGAYFLLKRWMAEMQVDPAFDPLVCYDENSSIIHGIKSGKMCERVALVDMGVRFRNYCSDATNTYVFDEELERIREVLIELLHELSRNARDGVRISELCDHAERCLKDYGFGEEAYFNFHSLGHGVGLEVHEEPLLTKNSNAVLKKNMTVAFEPAVYFKRKFGIRVETVVLVGKRRGKKLIKIR